MMSKWEKGVVEYFSKGYSIILMFQSLRYVMLSLLSLGQREERTEVKVACEGVWIWTE